MSVPVMLSLTAEPLTGLVDTAFIAGLGSAPVVALGIGVAVLATTAWIFNFLSIGTQTEVARAAGSNNHSRGRDICSLALLLSLASGVAVSAGIWVWMDQITSWMTTDPTVHADATTYLSIRLLGSPVTLVTMTALGAFRGLQDMRTPLWVATGTHALNIALDPILIFGCGPIPALGIAGAAWASTASQWVGAIWALTILRARLGISRSIHASDARLLCVTGIDLFIRTGLLTLFLLLAQGAANHAGVDPGAAHQGVRQIWIFTALALDAFAATAQSLVGYFSGAGRIDLARRAAAIASTWALGAGVALACIMVIGADLAARLFVPEAAHTFFWTAWLIAAISQPLNALSFVTDGVHWGTGDYRYLRNAMIVATIVGLLGLAIVDLSDANALTHIWAVTTAWITIRAVLGVMRIWPGHSNAPLGRWTRDPVTSAD